MATFIPDYSELYMLYPAVTVSLKCFLLVLDFPKELSDMFDPTKGKDLLISNHVFLVPRFVFNFL